MARIRMIATCSSACLQRWFYRRCDDLILSAAAAVFRRVLGAGSGSLYARLSGSG